MNQLRNIPSGARRASGAQRSRPLRVSGADTSKDDEKLGHRGTKDRWRASDRASKGPSERGSTPAKKNLNRLIC